MGCKREATKGAYELVDELSEGDGSNGGDNQKVVEGCSSRSVQETKCSTTSKDVFNLTGDSGLEILCKVRAEYDTVEEDGLGDAEVVSPINR